MEGGKSYEVFHFLDLLKFDNTDDDGGMGNVHITVKANSCDVVSQQYESLKKQLTESFPVLKDHFKFENLELSPLLKVCATIAFICSFPFMLCDFFWFSLLSVPVFCSMYKVWNSFIT